MPKSFVKNSLKVLATAVIVAGGFLATTKAAFAAACPTPTFSPVAGAITFGTTVTMSSAGSNHIYYTINGDTPTAASTDQTVTPLVVNAAETVKALAVGAGCTDSAIGSAAYTQAASANLTGLALSGSPTNYTFAGGTYSYTGLTVLYAVSTITVTPTGAGVITVGGVVVATGVASDPIALTAGTEKTISVVATETGKSAKTYTIKVTRNYDAPVTPAFSQGSTSITSGTTIGITSANADHIYYTTDGNDPTAASTEYSTPIAIDSFPTTLKALAVRAGHDDSSIGSVTYTLTVMDTTVQSTTSSSNSDSGSSCSDTGSVSTPNLFRIDGSSTSAKLFFSPIANTSGYYIDFSTKPSAEGYSAVAALGREGVQNYTIYFLKPNTTYYFKVRGQSGCVAGGWSKIMKIVTRPNSSSKLVSTAVPAVSQKTVKPAKQTKVTAPVAVSTPRPQPTLVPVTVVSPVAAPVSKKTCFLMWCW